MNSIHLIVSKDNSYNTALTKRLVGQHAVKSDAVDVFEGKTIELQQLDNALYTDSLISRTRAIVIHNIEHMKPDAIEAIIKFSDSPPEHILLVMTSENADALKQNKFETLHSLKTLKRHISLNQTTYSLIQDYIKSHNTRITRAAVDMLVSIFEVSTWGIVENEMNKLSTYAGNNGVIDENAVSELTFNLNKTDTFKFVNEILAHKEKEALKDLKGIKETGVDNIMVIGALAWKFRQLLIRSNNEDFTKGIRLLYEYNLNIRKGKISNTIALDKLTIELLRAKLY